MLVSAIFAGGGSCDAQQVGNTGQGRRVAHADCAQCHAIWLNAFMTSVRYRADSANTRSKPWSSLGNYRT